VQDDDVQLVFSIVDVDDEELVGLLVVVCAAGRVQDVLGLVVG